MQFTSDSGTQGLANKNLQQGAAVIEFALILPILILLFTVIFEFSRIMYLYNTLEKSVRDSSRYLASQTINALGETEITAERLAIAKNLAVSGSPTGQNQLLPGLSKDDVSISVETRGSSADRRYYITVSSSYTYSPVFAAIGGNGFIPQIIDLDFEMNSKSTMRAR